MIRLVLRAVVSDRYAPIDGRVHNPNVDPNTNACSTTNPHIIAKSKPRHGLN